MLNKLVIVLFRYNVSLHELPSENKVFIIIIIIHNRFGIGLCFRFDAGKESITRCIVIECLLKV